MTTPLEPVKIAYLINEYPKVSHSFVRREIDALQQLGVQVDIFSIRPWSADLTDPKDLEHAENTTVLYSKEADLANALAAETKANPRGLRSATALATKCARTSEKSLAHWMAYVAEAALLRQVLSERGIEHVHAHFGTNPAAVAMLTQELGGPTYSFTVHGPEEFDRQIGLSLDVKIERAAFVAAISSYGRSQLLRLARQEDRNKVHVVHCGLDRAFLESPVRPLEAAPTFVTVGRLSEQKGHWVLLDAARIVKDRGFDFNLVLVGDGELRPEVETEISLLGLGDHVSIYGWASEAEVKQNIWDSRALVLPSFAEGLPVVIMESLALHRPVISTYVAGIPELVVPGECGWLVPAGNVESLADAMVEVLEASPGELQAMGANGAKRVAKDHDVNVEASRLLGLFCQTLGIDVKCDPAGAQAA